MIIIGHSDIPSVKLVKIDSIDDIKTTKPNSIVLFDYDISLMKHCVANGVEYAVNINSIKEAIFANSLGARFIVSNEILATQVQPIAQNYMFDARNLAKIDDEDRIEALALKEIDGVIF